MTVSGATEKKTYQYRSKIISEAGVEILLATDYPLQPGESIQLVNLVKLKLNRADGTHEILNAVKVG
ncbi:MAG TPA: hypothetical protein VIQ31_26330 [Phormidium sp.]